MTATRLAAALFCVLAFSAEAWARTETLHWTHPQPSTVTGFKVYWTPSGGATSGVDVGAATSDATGYSAGVSVSDGVDVTFQVSAYNEGGEGAPSNSICRNASSQPCGTTTTPPPSGGGGGGGGGTTTANAAIAGFKLWDASTDKVIDSNFTGAGKVITNSCTSIEILGNSYLSGGSGSVKKQLCQGTACAQAACGQANVSYENTPPFAWEDDAGAGNFNCAPSLANNGTFTLQVTPYDGKNCSGTQGSALSVTFSVQTGGATSNPGLGTPGKPYLVQ
ncbi:MAG TPA: fibronectin type III domain-containing protein [Myxococcota bacterium]|nr:fibronectin type III domain-containing protein [Myxococcota bacterium]